MEFWLVQRIDRKIGHTQVTQFKHLEFDYMGSAEFEFGALPKAWKIMSESDPAISSVTLKAFGIEKTFFVVAPSQDIGSVGTRLQAWFDGGFRSKEWSRLDNVITNKGWSGGQLSEDELKRLPIAWWALRENVFFTLDENIATIWLDSLLRTKEAV